MKHLLALLLGIGSLTATACRSEPPAAELRVETVELAITGMTCAVACPPRVQAALSSVPGVESAEVDYDKRTATVVCVSSCDRRALVAALQKQGFGGRLL